MTTITNTIPVEVEIVSFYCTNCGTPYPTQELDRLPEDWRCPVENCGSRDYRRDLCVVHQTCPIEIVYPKSGGLFGGMMK